MSEENHECACGWITLFMCAIVAVAVAFFTWAVTDTCWRADAVRQGYARVLVQNEYGHVKWEWIPK